MRKYLERRAKEKEEEKARAEEERAKEDDTVQKLSQKAYNAADDKSLASKSSTKKKKFWGRSRQGSIDESEAEMTEADMYHSPRPAFFGDARHAKSTQYPRDVAVPYFR